MRRRSVEGGMALARELRTLMQELEELLRALGVDRSETLNLIRDRTYDALRAVRTTLAQAQSRAQRTSRRATVATGVYVQEHPWTTVCVGAALGMLLGSWLLRRPR